MQYIQYGYAPAPAPAPAKPPKTAADTFKRLLSGPGFLFVVIFTLAILVLQVVQAFSLSNVFTQMLSILKESGSSVSGEEFAEIEMVAEFMDKYFFSLALVAVVPCIFRFLGYLWLYMGAKNGKDKTVAMGATVFQVFNTIPAVILVLYLIFFAIAIGAVAVSPSVPEKGMFLTILGIFLLIIILIFKFYSNFAKMWKGLKKTVLTGENCCKVSSYVVFWCWVGIVLSIIGALASFAVSALVAIAAALEVVCMIVIIGVFTKFKDEEGLPQKK